VSKNLTPEILAEIRRVLERFGVQFIGPEVEPPKGKKIFNLDLTDTAQINQFLESRGADMYLLCTIGSWKDTISDQEVLRDLREWLRGGEQALRPSPTFATVRAADLK
jgi:hypothetical protein